jgi:DNA-binding transcriptional ArsR family regulator
VDFHLHPLPVSVELETTAVCQAARSHRALAELKGAAASIPNETILIDTLALQRRRILRPSRTSLPLEFIERDFGVSRPTTTKYLVALTKAGFVRKTKLGRTNFYINQPLFALLSN